MLRNHATLTCTAALAGLVLAGCKSHESSAKGTPAADVNPAQVQAVAKAPAPPPNATKQSSIGSGKASIGTSSAPGDTDSCWVQELDIDGDGTVERTTLLWDDEDKVLFAYTETDVPCEYGGVAVASVLVGVNAKGNPRGKPEGSGFFAVYLDATECGAEAAGLFGAKFNPAGEVTEAGEVIVDQADDTVEIVDVKY